MDVFAATPVEDIAHVTHEVTNDEACQDASDRSIWSHPSMRDVLDG